MKMRNRNSENSELDMNHFFDNGSGTAVVPGAQCADIEQAGSSRPTDKKARSSLARRGTGPRTRAGKERSKRNAIRHGIFSDVVVLASESRREYLSLLKGLQDTLQPEGTLEELLVEQLASLAWRIRRLLVAEGAEVRHNIESFAARSHERELREIQELETKSALPGAKGLIAEIHNPYALDVCLLILGQLRRGIEGAGFDQERDTVLLEKIYGIRDEARPKEDLYQSYLLWSGTAKLSDEEREGYASPAQCQEQVRLEIDREVRRLERYQKVRTSIEAEKTHLEMRRRSVPEGPALDRLLRYEASLERSFDRTLSQLERLQRMRAGQPVLPELKVRLSG
jgi:hypothetical protein